MPSMCFVGVATTESEGTPVQRLLPLSACSCIWRYGPIVSFDKMLGDFVIALEGMGEIQPV